MTMPIHNFRALARMAHAALPPGKAAQDVTEFVSIQAMSGYNRIEATNGQVTVRRTITPHGDDAEDQLLEDLLLHGKTLLACVKAFGQATSTTETYEVELVYPNDDEVIAQLIEVGMWPHQLASFTIPRRAGGFPKLSTLPWSPPPGETPTTEFGMSVPQDHLRTALQTTTDWRVIVEPTPDRQIVDGDTGLPLLKPGPVRLTNPSGTWTALIEPAA